MALIIAGMKFTSTDNGWPAIWNDVFEWLKKLPSPRIVDKPGAVVVSAYEAESIESSDEDLGTENVCGCVALYLYGGGKRLLIHVNDSIAPLELDKRLERFPIDCQIQAVLVGGKEAAPVASHFNIVRILSEMIISTRDINLVSRWLIFRNLDSPEARFTAIYNQLMRRFMCFYRHLYDSDMPQIMFWRLNPNCFRNQFKLVTPRNNLKSFCEILINLRCLLEPTHTEEWKKYLKELSHTRVKRIDFLLYMREIISFEGLKILTELGFVDACLTSHDLSDMFFHHLENGEAVVSRMSPLSNNPFQYQRIVHLYILSRFRKTNHYFDAYRDRAYMLPPFDADFAKKIMELKILMKDRVRTPEVEEAVKAIVGNLDNFHFECFVDAVLKMPVNSMVVTNDMAATSSPVIFRQEKETVNKKRGADCLASSQNKMG